MVSLEWRCRELNGAGIANISWASPLPVFAGTPGEVVANWGVGGSNEKSAPGLEVGSSGQPILSWRAVLRS